MSPQEKRLIERFLIAFAIAHLIALILILMPRKHTRRFRHQLAALVMATWVSTSRVLAITHEIFWQKGNGH